MMDHHTLINGQFPVRKSKAQKEAFRAWACEHAGQLGYAARVESHGKKASHNNVVIGDPETAKVIFTAHYDTPARSMFPNLMFPQNVGLFLLYQFMVIGVMIALAIGFGVLVGVLSKNPQAASLSGYGMYWVLLLMMLLGPANKHNANDNTSGVAAVFALMEQLPQSDRSKVAFILFDNEEKGKLGSQAYAKAHKALKENSFVVNLDCVGLGDTVILSVPKGARALPQTDALEAALAGTPGRDFACFRRRSWMMNSDHASFKQAVMICACKHRKGVGYYCPHIHTPKDTVCQLENIDFLARGLAAYVAGVNA